MLHIKSFFFNPLQARCCVVWDDRDRRCALIDPGIFRESERQALDRYLTANGLVPEKILLTHGHFDHIYGVKALQRQYGLPVYLHPADRVVVAGQDDFAGTFKRHPFETDFGTTDLRDGDILPVGGHLSLTVIATPGHTPGGVCYYDAADGILFSGDTLFAGSIGRSDLPGGDYDSLIRSIMDRLMGLPGSTGVLPGHGPETTIARETATNPFLEPFNEPDPDSSPTGLHLDGTL